MCCHNSPKRKALHATLQDIDPAIPAGDKFWHNKGRVSDGTVKVSAEEAEAALDAAFVAAVSEGTADPDGDWHEVDSDERLDMHIAWMRARNELLEEGMTASELAALSRYVTEKQARIEAGKEAVIADAVDKRTLREQMKTTRAKIAASAFGVLALISMAGIGMGLSSADTVTNNPATISAPAPAHDSSTLNMSPRSIDASAQFKVGGKTVYTKMAKGKCAPDQIKTKMTSKKKVNWEWKNGNIGKKTVKKGKTVCKFTSANGKTVTAPTNSAGVLTALPSNFPKNPTAADIASLGLTKDSKVSPTLRIPQPAGAPVVKGELAETVRPVRVVGYKEFQTYSGFDLVTRPMALIEWRITGGSGVLQTSSLTQIAEPGSPFGYQYTKLDPNGSVTVLDYIPVGEAGTTFLTGRILPDYGQVNLPPSTVSEWKVPAVKDNSGIGLPVGKTANTSYWNQAAGPRDGFVNFDAAGNILGTYDY